MGSGVAIVTHCLHPHFRLRTAFRRCDLGAERPLVAVLRPHGPRSVNSLGDPEGNAVETLGVLVSRKALGIKAEQEAAFVFLIDQRKPIGPMAGVRIQDGKVDRLFINNRVAIGNEGSFNVLNSNSPDDIRKLLARKNMAMRT